MDHATIIGIDLAKRSFQLHGARPDGSVAFRKKLSRNKLLAFVASHPRCVVAMEACASAHHWGRAIGNLGHEVKLVPPIYVKPFVKRQKNDAADAEAICKATARPTMRFVAVKTQEQQARGMLFHTRDLLVRQRTQTINALRGHFAEFGVIAPRGPAHVKRLAEAIEDADSGLPDPVRELGALLLVQVAELDEKIAELEKELCERAREDEQTVRLMSVPGIGPLCAMAIQAFAPPMESFRHGRDFSAWLGLVPRQSSTGGRPRFHLHFTPTSASWLNQVERWFGLLSQRAIKRGSFHSVTDLVNKIQAFIDAYNTSATPFVWVATAQSIIDKVARIAMRISGTAH